MTKFPTSRQTGNNRLAQDDDDDAGWAGFMTTQWAAVQRGPYRKLEWARKDTHSTPFSFYDTPMMSNV